MRVDQWSWSEAAGWCGAASNDAALVLYFGSRASLACGGRYQEMRDRFPRAHILGCSSGGQIRNDDVNDEEITGAALRFANTDLRMATEPAPSAAHSRACGEAIGRALAADDLAGIFVLSDGLNVNGSELVAGITEVVGKKVPLTGGLAGDGARFEETLVGADCPPRNRTAAAIGFYGSAIHIGHGSAGGWDEFGPRRRVTRARGNVLYELDGEPALDLYERYLGEEDSKGLPGPRCCFLCASSMLARRSTTSCAPSLRSIATERSMTFAGDMPQGWVAQLMRGNFDRLAAGAATAARQACSSLPAATTRRSRFS